MKPYTCIVNDLALPINFLRKNNYHHQTYIIGANPSVAILSIFLIGANINYHQAISSNASIIVIYINLLIILQAILC